jgi:hypothetical protein
MHRFSTITFHKNKLKDGFKNFEFDETTCSHILKNRNGFLKGRTYGEALFEKIFNKKFSSSVLEIGAGLGDLAFDLNSEFRRIKGSKDFHYSIVDVSPQLIALQKKRLQGMSVQWIDTDITRFGDLQSSGKYDVVIANEMIADLEVQLVPSLKKCSDILPANVLDVYRNFFRGIKGDYPIPSGFIQMLNGLKKHCHSETRIFLSEYFTRHGSGFFVDRPGHREFTYNINLTTEIIRALGYSVEVHSMVDFLDMDLNHQPLSREFAKLFSDQLNIIKSRNELLSKDQAIKQIKLDSGVKKSVLGRSEWIRIFSNYYFLVLKLSSPDRIDKAFLRSVPKKNENVAVVQKGNDIFLTSVFPAKFGKLNKAQMKLWKQIDGKTSVQKLVETSKDNLAALILFKKWHVLS